MSHAVWQALLRPGRFDRKIEIALPTHSERVEIFKTHMKNLVLDGDGADYAKRLASLTPGHSGMLLVDVLGCGMSLYMATCCHVLCVS